jgi:hypothetical protein
MGGKGLINDSNAIGWIYIQKITGPKIIPVGLR